MVPPMSLFLHVVLSTYGVVLAHLHPNALPTLAIFQYLCEAFIRPGTLFSDPLPRLL
jgi:hypothetical protein